MFVLQTSPKMKKHLLIALVSMATISCEDDIVPTLPPPPPPANYAPLTVGNWWAYQLVRYNYYQQDTIYGSIDTLRVLADTIINGQIFKKLSGNRYSFNSPVFVRDSSGYVINSQVTLDYQYVNYTDTILVTYGNADFPKYLSIDSEPTLVPAGVFSTVNFGHKVYDFTWATNCGIDTAYWNIKMAENVGIVEYCYHYSAPGPCSPQIRRLVDYYVQ